jgi:hypothetical protein
LASVELVDYDRRHALAMAETPLAIVILWRSKERSDAAQTME